jgi:MFS family permease
LLKAQYLVSILLAVYGGTLLAGSRESNQFHPSEPKLKDIALFGYFADKSSSRKLPFVLGLIALGTSTALFAFARTFPILVIARGLQGFSAAAVWVVGLAIVSDNVPPERIGAALGTTTIGLTWGFLLGPMVSGYIHDTFGYYGCFAIPVILIVVDVVLRFAMIELPSMIPPRFSCLADSDFSPQRSIIVNLNLNLSLLSTLTLIPIVKTIFMILSMPMTFDIRADFLDGSVRGKMLLCWDLPHSLLSTLPKIMSNMRLS